MTTREAVPVTSDAALDFAVKLEAMVRHLVRIHDVPPEEIAAILAYIASKLRRTSL